MLKKPIGIGIENYKRLTERPYYYVDKTMMIKELLDNGGMVNLFTRPRRFGKTLTLSMIRTFFEKEYGENQIIIDNKCYFEGMKIMDAGEEYLQHMGRYPVISMTLKSARQPDYHKAYTLLLREIAREYDRHKYVLLGEALSETEKRHYQAILDLEKNETLYLDALKYLSECLKKYHKTNVIILLDEYDVPLENAFFRGFYEPMVDFIRSMFESALKTNDCLQFAVVTGCLRISRESIFTGLNNLEINSILDNNFAEYYGSIQSEVEDMLCYYGLSEKIEETKNWYDGYLFGETEVYNPWSIINYVKTAIYNFTAFPRPYWSNTSSNSIIRELVEKADGLVKNELEKLIAGGKIEKPVHEDITYGEIYKNQDNLWNFLFFTGYLKAVEQRLEGENIYMTMTIPNAEVNYIYKNTIREWFEEQMRGVDCSELYQGLINQDTDAVQNILRHQLRKSISYHDNKETFYHGFLLGLLSAFPDYTIRSNRESGNGRPDILLFPLDEMQPVIIIEVKYVEMLGQMEEGCDKALAQIAQQDYIAEAQEEGYEKILSYGICFCKKTCIVKS